MSNDPTPEAKSSDELKLEAALALSTIPVDAEAAPAYLQTLELPWPGDVDTAYENECKINETLAAAVRALRTKLVECNEKLKNHAIFRETFDEIEEALGHRPDGNEGNWIGRIVALRTKLAEVEGKLALVEAERDALRQDVSKMRHVELENENVLKALNAEQSLRTKRLEQIADLRAENERLKDTCAGHRKVYCILQEQLTSQQEAMDTAVRALEKLSSAVSARMCDGPEPAHDKVVRLMEAYDEARSFLAQLRASRAAQFPENGKTQRMTPVSMEDAWKNWEALCYGDTGPRSTWEGGWRCAIAAMNNAPTAEQQTKGDGA